MYIYIYISFEISYLNKQPSLFGAVAVSLHFLGINNFSLKKEKCIPFNTTAERERERKTVTVKFSNRRCRWRTLRCHGGGNISSHFNLQPSLKFCLVARTLVGRTENFHVRNNAGWNPLFPLECGDGPGLASKLEEFRNKEARRMVGCCVTKDRALFEIGHGSARRHHISTAGARKCVISSVQYLVGKFWRCLREGWRENFQLNHETCTMFAPREINSSLD